MARWRLSVRFVFMNWTGNTVSLDDIHARIYHRRVPTPPVLTISLTGDVMLMQDNSLLRDKETYSLASGDGYEINLILQMTRYEGAPAHSPIEIAEGSFRIIFGLFLDYYWVLPTNQIERRVIPSDCVYLFECYGRSQSPRIIAVDDSRIESICTIPDDERTAALREQLRRILEQHRSSQLRPKPSGI